MALSSDARAVLVTLCNAVPADRSRPTGLQVRDLAPLVGPTSISVPDLLGELRDAHLVECFYPATTGGGLRKGHRYWCPTRVGRAAVTS